jgi:anti-sigma factor RsiW
VAALTDEILMAYADGALDAGAAARIEALVKADPQAQARVFMFKATGKALSAPYEAVLQEPVPDRLIDFVMTYGKGRESPSVLRLAAQKPALAASLPRRGQRLKQLWADFRERLIPDGARWHLAAASGLALMVGAGAGFLLRGGGQDGALGPSLAALRQGQIVASGALHQVLETLPSDKDGRKADRTPGSVAVRAVLSFKAKGGSYCREYELAAAQGLFQGLACRQAGGRWAVEAHVAEQAQTSGKGTPAAQSEALNAIVDGRIEGDALGKDQEKAAIKSGWN